MLNDLSGQQMVESENKTSMKLKQRSQPSSKKKIILVAHQVQVLDLVEDGGGFSQFFNASGITTPLFF